MSSEERPSSEGYRPPQVEDLPADDGAAVTAAGITAGAEWRPQGDEDPTEEKSDER
ncbi:MAG: hypothetical protein QOE06_285 [Thermoleophilaceae bacterium]|jgi:hypothetical protein|nr:hypothetical protein [Thermoleophilaceae bacterium]